MGYRGRPDVGRSVLLILLLLAASRSAAAQDPAPEDRRAALDRLAAAARGDRHAETADLARDCLAWLTDPRDRVAAARAGAEALLALGRTGECIKMCDTFDAAAKALPHDAPWLPEEREAVDVLRGRALVRLGRAADAVALLGTAVRLRPDLLDDPEVRLALAVARADGPLTLDPDYRGKYARDPRLDEARRRLDRAFPAAVDRVRRRLGLGDPGFPPVAVLFQDAAGGDGKGGPVMSAGVLPRGGETVGILVITTEPIVTAAWPEEVILAHELTHVLGRVLGPGVSRPEWLEEGLAHWVSATDTSELFEYAVDAGALWEGRHPGDPVDARLADLGALRSGSAYDQRVAGMAFLHMLERVRGRADTVLLVHRLLAEPHRAAFLAHTGGAAGDLLPAVRLEWRKWREENLAGLDVLAAAVKTARGGEPREGLEAVEALLRANPRTAVAPVAAWTRARLLSSRDGDAAAVEAHRALRRAHPAAMTVQLYSRLDEALLLLRLGEREAAADLAREVRRDWAWWVPGTAEAAAGILRKAAEPAGKGR